MNGAPCKSRSLSPKQPGVAYVLLNNVGEGCGDLGEDELAVEADSVSEGDWLAANSGNADLSAALADLG